MKNIGIFFGGQSIEHDISCITGTLAVNSVDSFKYNVIPIYVDHDGKWWTGELLKDVGFFKNPDFKKLKRVVLFAGDDCLYIVKGKKVKPLAKLSACINCIHGERGEDGSLCGLLNMSSIPLASPPLFASSVSMSKSFSKIALKGLGVKTLPYALAKSREDAILIERKLGYPLIIKPDTGGSSIGISVAENRAELERGILTAIRYGEVAIIEPLVKDFTEINCACYNSGETWVVSECERPLPRSTILSFDDKYRSGDRVFPADIDKETSDKIKKTTQKVYENLGFSGIIRVDYIVKGKDVFLNEINSVPGSLAYYLFVKTTKEFASLLEQIISVALNEGARRSTYTKKFNSGILSSVGSKGAKRLKN